MPKFAEIKTITDAEAIALLRRHLADQPPPKPSEFKVGDAVRLDTGDLGVVESIDDGVNVYYLNSDGQIEGPAFGYSLTKLNL